MFFILHDIPSYILQEETFGSNLWLTDKQEQMLMGTSSTLYMLGSKEHRTGKDCHYDQRIVEDRDSFENIC